MTGILSSTQQSIRTSATTRRLLDEMDPANDPVVAEDILIRDLENAVDALKALPRPRARQELRKLRGVQCSLSRFISSVVLS